MTEPLLVPDGRTLLFATVGDPIEQAKAPSIMTRRFSELGVNATWLPIGAKASDLASVFQALREWSNFAGLSITIPHKGSAIHLVDRITPLAEASGGINVARREPDGSLSGDMVDGLGFVAALRARGMEVNGKSARLVGAGGAGSAIAAALCQEGIARLEVVDHHPSRVERLLGRLAHHYPEVELTHPGDLGSEVDLAINATPMGLKIGDPLPFEPSGLQPKAVVCEVVMEPAITPLLKRAAELGFATQPGLPMLERQVELYLDFFRVRPPAGR